MNYVNFNNFQPNSATLFTKEDAKAAILMVETKNPKVADKLVSSLNESNNQLKDIVAIVENKLEIVSALKHAKEINERNAFIAAYNSAKSQNLKTFEFSGKEFEVKYEEVNEEIEEVDEKFKYTEDDINMMYGYYGTLEVNYPERIVQKMYTEAVNALMKAYKISEKNAIAVLDSRVGRHMADFIHSKTATDAVDALVKYHGSAARLYNFLNDMAKLQESMKSYAEVDEALKSESPNDTITIELDMAWDNSDPEDDKAAKAAFKKFKIKVAPSLGHHNSAGTFEVTGKKKDILAYLQSEFYEMDADTIEEFYPELLEANDHEVGMAQGQLNDIVKNAQELMTKVGQQEKDIPGWIQDHISQAQNFINQANTSFHELEESIVTEGKFDKKKLLKMIKGKDDLLITTKNGDEFILYEPNNGNDENTAYWNSDKFVVGVVPNDGDEVNIQYDEITSVKESKINEGEVDLYNSIEAELTQIFAKLTELAKKTTDSKWKKAIDGIISGFEGVEAKMGQAASKLGVVPTNEGFYGPFVFSDDTDTEKLKEIYDDAVEGYANWQKGSQYSKGDYKKAYQAAEKILKKRGVKVDESAEINEGAVKQFEMDYKDMETSIRRGIGWIDPEYVEDTWENSSDAIDFHLVKTEIMSRLIKAGLLWWTEDGETKDKQVKSLKELGLKESVLVNESGMNDPVLVAFRAAKAAREAEMAKPKSKRKPLYGKQRAQAEDDLWYISQDLKDLYSERGDLLIDMEQEAEAEGGPIANEYGDKLNKIEDEIQKLIAKRNQLELRLAESVEVENLDEAQANDIMFALKDIKDFNSSKKTPKDLDKMIISVIKNLGYTDTDSNYAKVSDHLTASADDNDNIPVDKTLVKELYSLLESVEVNETIKIKDVKVGTILNFKDGEVWKVTKIMGPASNPRGFLAKPHDEKTKKSNISIEIEMTLDFLEKEVESINEARGGSSNPMGLSLAQTKKVAETLAKAIAKNDGTKCSVNKSTLEEDSFDLDMDYEGDMDGGSYVIYDDGSVVNVAVTPNEIYGNYKSSVEDFMKGLRKPIYEGKEVEVSLRYAQLANDIFDDMFSRLGKKTSTNTFKFSVNDFKNEFVEALTDAGVPANEIY